MKTKQDLLNEKISELKRERKENWAFYHEAQLWKEQRENADEYDALIKILESLDLTTLKN